jgi:hypothetical protein
VKVIDKKLENKNKDDNALYPLFIEIAVIEAQRDQILFKDFKVSDYLSFKNLTLSMEQKKL